MSSRPSARPSGKTSRFSRPEAPPIPFSAIAQQASYLEIYNECLFDLLDIATQPHEINVYEARSGRVTVNGLRCVPVASEAEAMALLFEGETNRVIGEHQLNRESSRSHSIFTLTVSILDDANDESATVSKINLARVAAAAAQPRPACSTPTALPRPLLLSARSGQAAGFAARGGGEVNPNDSPPCSSRHARPRQQ